MKMDRPIDAELGVNATDGEHRRLMELLAKFLDYVRAEASADLALATLHEALALGNDHMEHEESLMMAAGYPATAEHKLQHRTARLHYTTLMSDTQAIESFAPSLIEHVAAIQHLLQRHIQGPDRDLADYLKTQGMH